MLATSQVTGGKTNSSALGNLVQFYSSYAASVSSLSGALLARKSTYMLSIGGTLLE